VKEQSVRKVLVFLVLWTCINVSASEIPEVLIERQDVIVWNDVNFDALLNIAEDLKGWCKEKEVDSCVISDVSSFISLDRTKIFYHVSIKYTDDWEAVYVLSSENQQNILSKSRVSTWNIPFIKKLPFKPMSK
jgi:hypothetical protein